MDEVAGTSRVSPGATVSSIEHAARVSSHSTASPSPTCFVFGYGSIINNESRLSTTQGQGQVVQAQEIIQYAFIRSSAGYERGWNFRSSTGFTALGIRKVGGVGRCELLIYDSLHM